MERIPEVWLRIRVDGDGIAGSASASRESDSHHHTHGDQPRNNRVAEPPFAAMHVLAPASKFYADVSRIICSVVVIPFITLSHASMRSVSIPSSTAPSRISAAPRHNSIAILCQLQRSLDGRWYNPGT